MQIGNMTCAACAVTVGASLKKVDGVIAATVSFDDKTADVVYDPGKSGIEDFINATANVGYPSKILEL